jgi:hypothetical protein
MTDCRRGSAKYAGRDGDCTVVRLHGEHDISTVDELSEAIARATALDDDDLVIDLSGSGVHGRGDDRGARPSERSPPAVNSIVDAAIALEAREALPRRVWPRWSAQRDFGRSPSSGGTVVVFPTWE